jgi:hypothetical protein
MTSGTCNAPRRGEGVWERAVAAGAEIVHPSADQFYGDRAGRRSLMVMTPNRLQPMPVGEPIAVSR